MTEIEKFHTDIKRISKHERAENPSGYDSKKVCESIQNLFERVSHVPQNLSRAVSFYWQDEYIDHSTEIQNEPTEEHIEKLCGMLAFLQGTDEYEDSLSEDDWKELADAVNYEAETLPLEVLQDLMSIVVSKGALR